MSGFRLLVVVFISVFGVCDSKCTFVLDVESIITRGVFAAGNQSIVGVPSFHLVCSSRVLPHLSNLSTVCLTLFVSLLEGIAFAVACIWTYVEKEKVSLFSSTLCARIRNCF